MAKTRKSKQDYVLELWTHLKRRFDGIINKKDSTFEDTTKTMNNAMVIKLTANFYTLLNSFCKQSAISAQQLNKKSEDKKAKMILSSLIIYKFPTDVLDVGKIEDLDPLGEKCYKSAKNMVESLLNKTEANMNSQNTPKLKCEELLNFINHFCEAFKLWRDKDMEKVLESVVNYYEQWMRSYQVLVHSSMNEAQKKMVLNTLATNMNSTETRISKLVGSEKAKQICQNIKTKVESEPQTFHHSNVQKSDESQPEQKIEDNNEKPKTMEEKLAEKGIPYNMKTGTNLLKPSANKNNEESEAKENDSEKYVKDVNGEKMLDLDKIIMEEASKKYWTDFSEQIKNENFSRLFELLSELLERLKKISPEKHRQHLDDLLDVKFIQQTIENGMIDAKGFYGIFHAIWTQIKSLHAPSQDKEWDAWHKSILEQMGSNEASWAQLLPDVFNMFLFKLDFIENAVKIAQDIKKKEKAKMK